MKPEQRRMRVTGGSLKESGERAKLGSAVVRTEDLVACHRKRSEAF